MVSGANGFVGFAVVKELIRQGIEVTALVHHQQNRLDSLNTCLLKLVSCDMKDYSTLPQHLDHDYDAFFHFAWLGSAGEGRFDPSQQMLSIQASLDACSCAQALGCKTFIGVGSIMEDETLEVIHQKGTVLGKAYLYGSAKVSAHLLTQARASALGIQHIWPKITNAYGPGETSPRFINSTLRKLLNHEPLEFTSGTQNYDFIFIDDVACAFVACAQSGKDQTSYVLGSGHAQALRHYVEQMGQVIDSTQKLNFGSIPYGGVQLDVSMFSIDALTQDTGFVPHVSFEEGILKTYQWIKGEHHAEV